jgi:hypothetical protein
MAERVVMEPPKNTAFIIWGALVVSVLVYFGVGFFLHQSGEVGQANETLPTLRLVLALVACGETVIVVLFPKIMAGKIPTFFTMSIIRWALSESIAIFGLVLVLMGDQVAVSAGFVVWSLVLILATAPTDRARARWRGEDSAGHHPRAPINP